jgi:hypothetical protein
VVILTSGLVKVKKGLKKTKQYVNSFTGQELHLDRMYSGGSHEKHRGPVSTKQKGPGNPGPLIDISRLFMPIRMSK